MKLLNVFLWSSAYADKDSPNVAMSRAIKFYSKHCASASPSERIDCGYPGITANQCQSKKCCWDESVKGVPFCYQSAFWARNGIRKGYWVEPLPKECPSDPDTRINCGFSRITPDQCQSLGCCFDDQVRNVPWCFHKNEIVPTEKPVARTVHRTQNTFCRKLTDIGKTGITFECTDGFREASVCSLSCSNGISEGGKTFTQTCLNGEWMGEVEDLECDVVLAVPQFSNKVSRTFGTNMARLLGYRVQRLITGGKCSAPPTPENGTRECRQNKEPGRSYQYFCDFKCNPGYQQIGTSVRSCPSKYGNSNSWSGDAVICEPINDTTARQIGRQMCYKMEPSDSNIQVVCEPGKMYGRIQCNYSCINPADRLMRGPAHVECEANSRDPVPIRPVCISGFCDAIGNFENGSMECTNKELDGSECSFKCDEGFRLSGSATINCNGNSWDNQVPKCIPESLFGEGVCPASKSRVRRMIGGGSSSLGGFQVAIFYQGKFKCGGSLIAPKWVLTAGHCIRGRIEDYKVYSNVKNAYIGSSTELGVTSMVVHEKYTGKAQWDIGLIKTDVSSPIDQVLCLPKPNFEPSNDSIDFAKVTLYGHGSTSPYKNIFPSTLQQGALSYLPSQKCGYIKQRFDADNLFCAKGAASACQGDSGGPVTFEEENGKTLLLGVTSSGRCGNDNKPGLYIRVAKFIPWIHQHVLA